MTLVLTITNVERLENGLPTRLRLDRHGAVIGRSPTADWSLPDPQHYISSIHCEIDYRDGAYVLNDKSTNGTFVNGAQTRMSGPHTIAPGDVIIIGHYSINAQLDGGAGAGAAAQPAADPQWNGWQSQPAAAGVDPASWDRPPPAPAISGQGAMSQNWAPPPVDEPQPASAWATPPPPQTPASDWSSAAREPSGPASAADVWGQLAASNVVDWARGGFGTPAEESRDPLGLAPPTPRLRQDPLGLQPAQPAPAGQSPDAGWGPAPADPAAGGARPATGWGPQPSAAPSPAPLAPPARERPATGWGPQAGAQPQRPATGWGPQAGSAPQPAAVPAGDVDAELAAFMVGAGLQPSDLKVSAGQAMTAAGSAMRRMISGLVVMLEARARAKAQLGAQGTSLEFDGNNPLKFARSPEKAVAQLLNPPERGFMSSDRAIEDAFRDLQAHQMATLQAMQGALQATLARFSPQAIRERAESHGVLARILPNAREATLWQTYEREFEGVAKGSDEAFMDVFAKEFRSAYERVAAEMKRKA